MFRKSIRCLSPLRTKSTSATKLLGFNNTKDILNENNYSNFLKKNLNLYPLNLILTQKTKAFKHPLNEILLEIEKFENINPHDDPNDYPILIDYKIIDYKKNKFLYNIFLKEFECIERKINNKENILILSFSKEILKSDISFMKLIKEKYDGLFNINACILSIQTYPFLKQLKSTKSDKISENLYLIASLGLVNVTKLNDGYLVLTKK